MSGTWDKEGTVKESRRTRLDPAVLLYDQIALPIINTSFTEPVNVKSNNFISQHPIGRINVS